MRSRNSTQRKLTDSAVTLLGGGWKSAANVARTHTVAFCPLLQNSAPAAVLLPLPTWLSLQPRPAPPRCGRRPPVRKSRVNFPRFCGPVSGATWWPRNWARPLTTAPKVGPFSGPRNGSANEPQKCIFLQPAAGRSCSYGRRGRRGSSGRSSVNPSPPPPHISPPARQGKNA